MALMFGLLWPPAAARAADSKLLLEVVINGRDTHKLADFVEREGGHAGKTALYATRSDLRELGLRVKEAAGHPDNELVCLANLPGIAYRLDGPTQTLDIRASDRALIPASLDSRSSVKLPPVLTGTGAVLNYDSTETFDSGRIAWRTLLDGRVFAAGGVLDSQFLLAAGPDAGATRLDSTISYADPDRERSYQAGDIINGGLGWTRPVRIGGLQIQSDFAVRPDLVTFPTPLIGGSAAVPSTVDVLVNNVRLLSHNVDPGPFSLAQLPIVTGANAVTLVTRDALGQQTTQTLPFYTTPRLLLPGLAAYSVEFGVLRNEYGVRSDDYSSPASSFTARYGLIRLVTLEAHGEASSSLGMGGTGAAVNLGNVGVLTASAAGSTLRGHDGAQFAAGFERVARLLTLSASFQRATPFYADLAAVSGTPAPRQQMHFGAGLSLGRVGALNLSYTTVYARPASVEAATGENQLSPGLDISASALQTAQPTRTALLSLTYTTRIWGNIQGYATGFHDFDQSEGTGLVISLSVPLGLRRSASITAGSAGGQSYLSEQMSQAAINPGEIGGTILNQNGAPTRQMAQFDTVTTYGDFDVGIDRLGHSSAFRTGQSGSVAAVDGQVFTGRNIQDSFAVVDTGLPHVQIMQENRPAGTTDQNGLLLLPNLQSFAANHIGLGLTSIPLDADLRSAVEVVRPQSRTGVVVKFALKRRSSATMHLIDEAGAFLPIGSIAVLDPGGPPNVVGYDGTAFVRDLKPHNRLLVTRPDGKQCSLEFGYKRQGDVRPDFGQLTCHAQRKI